MFVARGSGYDYDSTWSEHRISARISRIAAMPGDGLKAEVSVMLDGQPVLRTNPTLTSVSGMDGWYRKLQRRRPPKDYSIDWEAYTEELAGLVIDARRQGSAASELDWDAQQSDDVWLIEPYILKGTANLLYGDPGTAKSLLAMWFTALLSTGHVEPAHDLVAGRAKVLYLDYETSQDVVTRRMKWLHAGMGISDTAPTMLYRYCVHPLASEVDEIQDILEKRGWAADETLLVIDSQGLATGGRLQDEEAVLAYFAALRAIGGTSLTISHTNKDGGLFGSQYSLAATRNLWQAERSALDAGQLSVGLFHRKGNDVGREKPRPYQLNFSTNPETGHTKSVAIKASTTYGGSVAELTLRVVREEGGVAREDLATSVANLAEKRPSEVRGAVATALSRHLRNGKLVEEGGVIQLPVPVKEPVKEPVQEESLWKTSV